MDDQRQIYDLLFRLGVTANYTGFFYTSYALQLCLEEPERLLLVTKCVYPDVAKRYNTTWKAVERNLRTIGCIVWEQSHHQLERLAGRTLEHKPSTAQLLSILSHGLSPLYTASTPAYDLDAPAAQDMLQPLSHKQLVLSQAPGVCL